MSQTQVNAQQDLLDCAGNMLGRHDFLDISVPGIIEQNGLSHHGMISVSGLSDSDYESLSKLSNGHKELNQVVTVNKVPIPPEILEHFKHIKCHCMMGLFPAIGRAWLTIDSEIYIWTYEQTRDVAYYDGLNQLIVSVGLVSPKPKVFIEDVKYLLVLATVTEIVVLGVTFCSSAKSITSPSTRAQNTTIYEEMQLMNKPIFILSADSVAISVIQGTSRGRIFLGGKDGCLYEIFYQAESTWFGKRCKKINHSQGIVSYILPNFLKVFSENDPIVKISVDDTHNMLYVLTEKCAIEAWDMGADADSMRRIARLSENEITRVASRLVRSVHPSSFSSISALCPLTTENSQIPHLLAVTRSGVRLYFSTFSLTKQTFPADQVPLDSSSSHPYYCNPVDRTTIAEFCSSKPQGLYLLHIRLPPGYTPKTPVYKPKDVHTAYYDDDGTLLMISAPQQQQNLLWSVSAAPFPNRRTIIEATTIMPLDGVVWGLAEIKDRWQEKLCSNIAKAQTPKKVVLLTNLGVHIIALLKPSDILQQLLTSCHGPHHESIKAFFQVLTEKEACATSLLLSCSEMYRGTDLAMWAAQAFMLYGGEPMLQSQMLANRLDQNPQQSYMPSVINQNPDRYSPQMVMSTPMSMRHPQSPTFTPYSMSPIVGQVTSPGPSTNSEMPIIMYSAKHDGLYLYVARIIRSFWKLMCVRDKLCSTLSAEDCCVILDDLYAVKAFLDANSINDLACTIRPYNTASSLTNGYSHMPSMNGNDQRNANERAQAEEKKSLSALNYFINHTCEVIALWKILCEHQFPVLAKQLTKEQQDVLYTCTFRELILARSDICAFLLVALINSYLKDNASVTAISTKLREVCPNLYRHEDAVTFKATEILMSSNKCRNQEEKNAMLAMALQLCKGAAPNLPLQNICQQFTLVGYPQGVIELAATCAAKVDPDEIGIQFYNNGEPPEDREGYAAYAARVKCYKEVRYMLDHVYDNICLSNREFSHVPCPPEQESEGSQIMRIVSQISEISDPLLHVYVYEWLQVHDMLYELLEISEPSLGEFLRRAVVRNPENLKLIDLLWKYYEKNKHHSQAAKILDNLASQQSVNIPLVQRIEYLARAVMCMRNDDVGCSTSNGILLKDLEDKLEIARVQKIVLDAISTSSSAENNLRIEKAISDLNYALYDITQLYQNFAEPFELWEAKLTILNCSHYNDPLLIESVWGQILNNTVNGPGSAQEKCTRLIAKVQTLVQEFGESGHCVPLAFLMRELEIKSCQLQASDGTIPEALVNMGIEVELLIDYYSRMISMNERVWSNEGNEWHLVQSCVKLVNLVADRINTIPSRSRRRIVGKAQDIISASLNLCYPKPDTDILQRSLKTIQSRLQRLL